MSEIKNVDIIEDELLNRLENRVEGADGFQELRSFFDWYKANRAALEAPPLKDDEIVVQRSFVTNALDEHKQLKDLRVRYDAINQIVNAEFIKEGE